MNYEQFQEELKKSYRKDLSERKTWYSDVAEAYNQVRPRYPQALINRAVELAQLPAKATILEVGCGPGNATLSWAQLGFSMLCLEPSLEACRIARQNCQLYPSVEIRNTSFEEWELQPGQFHAVLAANSWHWIPPEISYAKAVEALQENGSLILLWNLSPQIPDEVYQALKEVYQAQGISPQRYEDRKTQEEILSSFGQMVMNSGRFGNLISEHLPCELSYSIDDYLLLLNTLSPYRGLESNRRDALFQSLREALGKICGETVSISFLSAFQIAQKRPLTF